MYYLLFRVSLIRQAHLSFLFVISFTFISISFMFKIATPNLSTSLSKTQLKQLKQNITDNFVNMEPYLDELIPKKGNVLIIKSKDVKTLVVEKSPLFFEYYDVWLPTLTFLHKYPYLKSVQVDKGAIKFLLSGANVMCPGLTSKGGIVEDNIEVGDLISIRTEGKELEIAIGKMKMSGKEIKSKNTGEAIEIIHVLGDDLWKYCVAQHVKSE
eukprot:NODE_39_length_29903_cov_0.529057.p13 type:complete len:212 gc:universal NODE_39_length_29903_cov_0.529057:4431-5066(+)